MSEPIPGLHPIGDINIFAPASPKPVEPNTRKGDLLRLRDDTSKLLIPVAAVGGIVLQPEGPVGKYALTFLTGFKVGEAAELTNKVGPGAALFLAPEPIGMLPERAFQSKPKIPGTNVYLDPIHNYKRFEERKDQNRRTDVGSVQLKLLNELLPTLTTDQVRVIYLDQELRRANLTYINPQVLDTVLRSELDRRRVIDDRAGAALLASEQRDPVLYDQRVAAEAVVQFLRGDFYGFASASEFLAGPAVPAANGSILPEDIEPVSDSAKRTQALAKGIRKMLVSERADP